MGSITDNSRFKESVGFAFAQLARRHRKRAETLLGEIDLHVGQEMLLSTLLNRPAVTQSELAELLRVQPATLSNSLQRLERRAFVRRTRDPDDQRIVRVDITEEGRRLIPLISEKWSQLEQETFGNLTQRQRADLRRLLMKGSKNLGDSR